MGIPLLAGRDVSAQDRETAPRVGRRQPGAGAADDRAGGPPPWVAGSATTRPDKPIEIVGTVADAHFASLRDPAPPTIYFPFASIASTA